jgi:hypothetical protein
MHGCEIPLSFWVLALRLLASWPQPNGSKEQRLSGLQTAPGSHWYLFQMLVDGAKVSTAARHAEQSKEGQLKSRRCPLVFTSVQFPCLSKEW